MKNYPMKKVQRLLFLVLLLFIISCKKDTSLNSIDKELTLYKDSVYFTLDGKSYYLKDRFSTSVSNMQVNIKQYTSEKLGRKAASITGNYFWYGEPDSTLFSIASEVKSESAVVEMFFSKKINNNLLTENFFNVKAPKNIESLYKIGVHTFAIDYDKENTKEGVGLTVYFKHLNANLSSFYPGFSMLIRPNLGADIQDDASFEIIESERIDNKYSFIKGKFHVSLYDNEGKKYRISNGYFQLVSRTSF